MTNILEALSAPDRTKFDFPTLVQSVSPRTSRNGKGYLSLRITDLSGTATVQIWDPTFQVEPGIVYRFCGRTEIYGGNRSLKFESLDPTDIPPSQFRPVYDTSRAESFIREVVAGLPTPHRNTFDAVMELDPYGDGVRWNHFLLAPAAVTHHHNRVGGLAVHTAGVLRNIRAYFATYNSTRSFILDSDISSFADLPLLSLAAIFHDLGKTLEYVWDPDVAINPGNLIPHHVNFLPDLAIADLQLRKRGDESLGFQDMERLRWLIVSHHGGKFSEFEAKDFSSQLLQLADQTDALLGSVFEGKVAV